MQTTLYSLLMVLCTYTATKPIVLGCKPNKNGCVSYNKKIGLNFRIQPKQSPIGTWVVDGFSNNQPPQPPHIHTYTHTYIYMYIDSQETPSKWTVTHVLNLVHHEVGAGQVSPAGFGQPGLMRGDLSFLSTSRPNLFRFFHALLKVSLDLGCLGRVVRHCYCLVV